MAVIVALTNNKGGVGKTTTALNLGVGIAMIGHKVLLIDADPQANLSSSFKLDDNSENNLGNFLIGGKKWKEILHRQDLSDNRYIDIAPAARAMESMEKTLFSERSREKILRKALEKEKVREHYDFVIIDCGPNLGLLTTNALCAADEFIIPFQTEFYSFKGTSTILEYAQMMKEPDLNPSLEFGGIIITKFHENMRGSLPKEFVRDIKESEVGQKVYSTYIRTNNKLMESPMYGKSIFEFDDQSNGSTDYKNLVVEFLTKHVVEAA
jgi:chromosome partitioning protein